MVNLPPLPTDQRKIDADQLNLLSIFHFVGAGLGLLGILFLGGHYTFVKTFIANPKTLEHSPQPGLPVEVFAALKWFYLVMGLFLLCYIVLNVLSGIYIRARKNRTFSLVVGGLNCLHIPVGTVLGVFTIIVLLRDSVREAYEAGASRP